MKAAIIAAGLGERLRDGGIHEPKPLVRICDRPLIDYALSAVAAAGLNDVACIVNDLSSGIEDHCRREWPDLRFEFVRRTTPSSMESLFTLAPLLGTEPFVLLTVDAVFAPALLRDFLAAAARRLDADGVLAVNRFVDDEKPLWVRMAANRRITAFGPAARDSGWVTAGYDVLDPAIFTEITAARAAQSQALRVFVAHLLERGYGLYAEPVGKSVDVDRVEDIGTAEAFVRSGFTE